MSKSVSSSNWVSKVGRGRSKSDGDEQTIARPVPMIAVERSSLDGSLKDGSDGDSVEKLILRLDIESKIKEGAENMLQVLESKKLKDPKEISMRKQVESELDAANSKIVLLQNQVSDLSQPAALHANDRNRGAGLYPDISFASPSDMMSVRKNVPKASSPSSSLTLDDLLQSLDESNRETSFYVTNANKLVELLKANPAIRNDLAWSAFWPILHFLLCNHNQEIVGAAFRIARYAIQSAKTVQILRSLQMDAYIIRSLAKDSSFATEREQALRLVRCYIDLPSGASEVSRGVIRAVVACAEQTDDHFGSICLETVAELLVLDPKLVASAGGLRILLQSLTDGRPEISDAIASAILYTLDVPATRKYVHAVSDLEVVLSPFTDGQHRLHVHQERVRCASVSLLCMFRHWSGLFHLCMHNMRSIRYLVEALKIPSFTIRDALLDLFFAVLRIKGSSWTGSFLAGRRLTTFGRAGRLKNAQSEFLGNNSSPSSATGEEKGNDLVSHFTGIVLAALLESEIIDNLVKVVEQNDATTIRKATLLLSEILQLSSKILPRRVSAKYQSLSNLFAFATTFGSDDRFIATSALYQMDSIYRTTAKSIPLRYLIKESVETGSRMVENVKNKINSQIDEAQFRAILVDTQVLNTKNYTKWKWDLLSELLHGPLMSGKRLDEAIRATKFMKRLTSFYRPFKHRFSDIKNTKPNQRYVRIGCSLITCLLASPDGVKYLGENKLLRQLAECLAQLDPMSGITSADPLFSKQRLQVTLCSGYFSMIGTLCANLDGIQMLDRWHVFNMLYHITELQTRNEMILTLLRSLDYSLESHPRILLAKAMTSSDKDVRMGLTRHLRTMIGESGGGNDHGDDSEWAIRLLVAQLYDPNIEVCGVAVQLLDEICSSSKHLEFLVSCRPTLDHLGEVGGPLLLRFLSTSVGYHYLTELEYVEQEMDDWFHGKIETYVYDLEAALAMAYVGDSDRGGRGCCVLPHFYGELAKTTEGCRILSRKGHFQDFARFTELHCAETSNPETILKLKSCLWAIGNVAASEGGVIFLEMHNVVERIIFMANKSPVNSLRGTALFVLGLVSTTIQGQEILDSFGWQSTMGMFGETIGICLPAKLGEFLSMDSWEYDEPEVPELVHDTTDPVDEQILTAISNLSNHILANEASKTLASLKSMEEEHFTNVKLHSQAMLILESYRYRQPVRRFILDLFDPSLTHVNP